MPPPPSGYTIAMPDASAERQVGSIKNALTLGKGGVSLVETTAGGFGRGATAAPRKDYIQERYGAVVPENNITLRDSSASAVLHALGVPEKLYTGDGAAMREAWRLMVAGPVQVLAALLEAEIATKLERPMRLDLSPCQSVDARGLGRAYASLTTAGIAPPRPWPWPASPGGW